MATLPPADRPDLKKESLTFATVKGVGFGAGISAGVDLIANGVMKYGFKEKAPNSVNHILDRSVKWGIGMGVAYLATAAYYNHKKSKEISYLERLQSEVDAKNATPDTSVSQR